MASMASCPPRRAGRTALRTFAVLASVTAVILVPLVPQVAAQAHEHGPADAGVTIAHDAPPDGRTFVGNVNHFSVIRHGDDAIPDFHQDIPWRVVLNGMALVETTGLSGHDYDGVNTFDIVFPVPGEYRVEALDAAGDVAASFEGTVFPAPDAVGGITFSTSTIEAVQGQLVDASYSVHLAGGSEDGPIPHSDCTFEVFGPSGRPQFKAKTHTHEQEQHVRYTYSEFGENLVRVLCFQAYPSARATLFTPVLFEQTVLVLPGPMANADGAPVDASLSPGQQNAVVTAPAGDGMTLVGTFDPYTIVGPDTLQHLNVLAVDAGGRTIQHVDFTAILDGPGGRIFESETLHEYDGILEFTTRQAVPGPYTLRVTAEGAAGQGEITLTYVVAPPAVALNAGPVSTTLDAPGATVGTPSTWTFVAADLDGAFAHGELDVRITADGETVPWLMTKLHTHGDGSFPLLVALPTESAHTVEVTPFPLMAEPVVLTPATFTVQLAAGEPLAAGSVESVSASSQGASAAPVALLLAGLAVAAVGMRRRSA